MWVSSSLVIKSQVKLLTTCKQVSQESLHTSHSRGITKHPRDRREPLTTAGVCGHVSKCRGAASQAARETQPHTSPSGWCTEVTDGSSERATYVRTAGWLATYLLFLHPPSNLTLLTSQTNLSIILGDLITF